MSKTYHIIGKNLFKEVANSLLLRIGNWIFSWRNIEIHFLSSIYRKKPFRTLGSKYKTSFAKDTVQIF